MSPTSLRSARHRFFPPLLSSVGNDASRGTAPPPSRPSTSPTPAIDAHSVNADRHRVGPQQHGDPDRHGVAVRGRTVGGDPADPHSPRSLGVRRRARSVVGRAGIRPRQRPADSGRRVPTAAREPTGPMDPRSRHGHAAAQDTSADHSGGQQDFVPRYTGSDPYRPPPRLYTRLQWLGFALTGPGAQPSVRRHPGGPGTQVRADPAHQPRATGPRR